MVREAVYIRIIFEEIGHKQLPTKKQIIAMDMQFHWLLDRQCQRQFRIHWRPGKQNYANYWTKHHSAKHHKQI